MQALHPARNIPNQQGAVKVEHDQQKVESPLMLSQDVEQCRLADTHGCRTGAACYLAASSGLYLVA